MKRIFALRVVILFTASIFFLNIVEAQSPEKISYQAVIRNIGGALVANQAIGMRTSILQGSPTGSLTYQETYSPSPQTNANGLVIIDIGGGTPGTGTFSAINWAGGPYYLKTEIDPLGGTDYTITGITQLLSVPYAMYSKTADYNSLLNKPTIINSQWTSTGNDIYFNTGKVGIGTIPSDYNLTLNGRARFRPGLGGTAGILYTTTENTNIGFIGVVDNEHLGIWGSGGGGFGFVMDATSLNVGIGTTTPATKLDVNGVITATGANFTGTTTVITPVNANDAVTKAYVDDILSQLSAKGAIVIDADGNIYSTVRIGSQVWMAENLKTTKYRNGDLIGTSIPATSDISGVTSPKYQWAYDGSETNVATYGRLYTWFAVTDSRNVCPTGWHLPSDEEWTTLENYLIASGFNYDGTTTGNNYAKALASASGWVASSVTGAVGNTDYPVKKNATGFTALPGGSRLPTGSFNFISSGGCWWSVTSFNSSNAWYHYLNNGSSSFYSSNANNKYGFSVRCVRD